MGREAYFWGSAVFVVYSPKNEFLGKFFFGEIGDCLFWVCVYDITPLVFGWGAEQRTVYF